MGLMALMTIFSVRIRCLFVTEVYPPPSRLAKDQSAQFFRGNSVNSQASEPRRHPAIDSVEFDAALLASVSDLNSGDIRC